MGQAGPRLPAPHAGKSRSDSVPSALAATISYFVAWSVRRNRTFSGDPCVREHMDESRRGRLAARDFRIVKRHAPQVGAVRPAPRRAVRRSVRLQPDRQRPRWLRNTLTARLRKEPLPAERVELWCRVLIFDFP